MDSVIKDPRREATDILSKFMKLPENKRLKLLKNFPFHIDFTNQIIQGFVDCDNKYRDLLILSAGLHYQLTHANNQFASAMEVHSQSIEALSDLTSDPDAQEVLPAELLNLFKIVTGTLESLQEGFRLSIKLNQMAQDNYFRDVEAGEDRIFAADAREALAFFISERSRIVGTEDDAEIDEDALNSALNEWAKNFKEEK